MAHLSNQKGRLSSRLPLLEGGRGVSFINFHGLFSILKLLIASPIRRFHALSATGYVGLGLPLNALLLWLIPRCTDVDMKTYSWILAQLSITDLANICVSAITQYVYIVCIVCTMYYVRLVKDKDKWERNELGNGRRRNWMLTRAVLFRIFHLFGQIRIPFLHCKFF